MYIDNIGGIETMTITWRNIQDPRDFGTVQVENDKEAYVVVARIKSCGRYKAEVTSK